MYASSWGKLGLFTSYWVSVLLCFPVFWCRIFPSSCSFTTLWTLCYSSFLPNWITSHGFVLSSLSVKAPSTLYKDNYTLWCAIGCRTLLILFIDCMCITRHCQITLLCMALEIHSVHMYVYICIFIHSPRPSVLWDNNRGSLSLPGGAQTECNPHCAWPQGQRSPGYGLYMRTCNILNPAVYHLHLYI